MAVTIPTVNTGDEIDDSWGNLVGERVTYHDAVLEELLADWEEYAPSWLGSGTNPAIGNGSLRGFYKQLGSTVHFQMYLTLGSTSTLGTGNWSFTPPVGISQELTNVYEVGTWHVNDVSTNNNYSGDAVAFGNNIYCFINGSPVTYMVNNSPIAWAVGDHIGMAGTYWAA